ncbi:hypothetical protein DL96DRAFT_1759731 [Flagelloscypha sp. PMI_526]|nr:hypothetical protein DL96DRAFT_1759731 [Flagelloscypha sp. PMI_526]
MDNHNPTTTKRRKSSQMVLEREVRKNSTTDQVHTLQRELDQLFKRAQAQGPAATLELRSAETTRQLYANQRERYKTLRREYEQGIERELDEQPFAQGQASWDDRERTLKRELKQAMRKEREKDRILAWRREHEREEWMQALQRERDLKVQENGNQESRKQDIILQQQTDLALLERAWYKKHEWKDREQREREILLQRERELDLEHKKKVSALQQDREQRKRERERRVHEGHNRLAADEDDVFALWLLASEQEPDKPLLGACSEKTQDGDHVQVHATHDKWEECKPKFRSRWRRIFCDLI